MRAVRHTLGLDDEIVLMSDSPFAADSRVVGDVSTSVERPDLLVVDAFPAGLRGELSRSDIPAIHLARLLRWDVYRELVPPDPPRFTETLLIEPVADEHLAYLHSVSDTVRSLELVEPPASAEISLEPGTWLIVHSGPEDEVRELVAYARETAALEAVEPPMLLITPLGNDFGVSTKDIYPAWPLFGDAARIITGAGCNVMRQAAPWRDKHRVVPFPRRFDDQFARARQNKP